MANTFEQAFGTFEPAPELKIQVVAILEDGSAHRCFVKAETGDFLYLDQGLEHCEKVDEAAVASAIIKHGYKPVTDGAEFAFGERSEVLGKGTEDKGEKPAGQ